MVRDGKTFLIRTPPDFRIEHLYVVISTKENKALLVNITSNNFDNSCVLQKGDHPFLNHSSYINYKDALLADIDLIKTNINNKVIDPHADFDFLILDKIKEGAARSKNFKQEYLSYL